MLYIQGYIEILSLSDFSSSPNFYEYLSCAVEVSGSSAMEGFYIQGTVHFLITIEY